MARNILENFIRDEGGLIRTIALVEDEWKGAANGWLYYTIDWAGTPHETELAFNTKSNAKRTFDALCGEPIASWSARVLNGDQDWHLQFVIPR